MSIKKVPIHPFLFAVYPVLTLLASNIWEVPIRDAFRSFAAILLLALILYGILQLFFRDWQKSALISSMSIVGFFAYWHVYTLIKNWSIAGFIIGRNMILLLLWGGLFAAGTWWVIKKSHRLDTLTSLLNTISILALIIPTYTILSYQFQETPASPQIPVTTGEEFSRIGESKTTETTPDIYYIILDGYARTDVLTELYGYDNDDMLTFLDESGFYVADESYSNYNQTALSLASSLNMDYINNLIKDIDVESSDRRPLGELIRHSQVRELLSQRGYQLVAFDSGFNHTDITDADHYLGSGNAPSNNFELKVNIFESLLLNTTVFRAFLNVDTFSEYIAHYLVIEDQFEEHRQRILYEFSILPEIAKKEGNYFVFAHIIAPHPPFVFDAEGARVPITHEYRLSDGNHYPGGRKYYLENYPKQLHYINTLLQETIEQILANSKTPPIIILQADHGPGRYLIWQSVEKSNVKERLGIFNAYYFPNKNYDVLYSSITPVNSFRVLFNLHFDQNFELLEDETYFSTQSRPYEFFDVSNRLD